MPKYKKQPLNLLKQVNRILSNIKEEERAYIKALQKVINKKNLVKQALTKATYKTKRLEFLYSYYAKRKRATKEAIATII